MTGVPAPHVDAWREFAGGFTYGGKMAWRTRTVSLLEQLAFSDTPTREITSALNDSPRAFKESRRDLEEAMQFLGSLAVEPGAGRELHHAVIAGLATRWIELEREHGLYPPPMRAPRQGATKAERRDISERQRELLRTPEGGLIAGMLRMGVDHMMQAVAGQLSTGDTTGERMEVAVREAEDRFQSALFSFEEGHGSNFTSFMYKGMIRFVPQQLIRAYGRNKRFTASMDDTYPGENGEGASLGDLLPDEAAVDPSTAAEKAEDGEMIHGLLDRLHARHRHMLERRFGLNGQAQANRVEEIAEEMGVSKARGYDIERDAMRQLRAEMKRRKEREAKHREQG